MPRYLKPEPFGDLTSAHRQTIFLRSLSQDHFDTLQNLAQTAKSDDVHAQAFSDFASADRRQVIWALWQEHHARQRGEKTGGGLGSALNWIGQTLTQPVRGLWNFAKNAHHYFTHSNTVSGHTRVVAMAIQETYKKNIDDRKETLGPYTRVPEFSSSWLDVWRSDDTKQILVTCRGSRDASDWLVDDVGIAAGTGPRDLISSELKHIFQKYDDDYHIEISGHSLGGSLVATALKNNPDLEADRIDFFNPGSSPISHDAVNSFSGDEKAHYYMNAIDPVSLGQLAEKPVHLVLNSPQSWTNPVANHDLKQWIFQEKI